MSTRKYQSDVNFIEALAELLKKNDLTEIEVLREIGENDTLNVRVARQVQPAPVVHTVAAASVAAPVSADVRAPAVEAAPPADAADPSDHPGIVPSPMVGTVYLQSEPGTPPFVSIGDTVTEGQTVLIIEAMKTMNQIPAPHGGKVTRILVEDSSPVEFGAPLLIIE